MKVHRGILVTALLALGLYGQFVTTPGSAHLDEANQVLGHQRALFENHLKSAEDRSQNAFYHPTFAAFLGRFGAEYKENTSVEKAVWAMGRYSGVSFWGNRLSMPEALQKNDPELTRAVADFAQLYPAFHEMVKLPHNFPADPNPPSMASPEINLAQRSRLGLALMAYTEYLASQQQWEPALQTVTDTYRYVHQLREQDCFELSLTFRSSMAQQTTLLAGHLLRQPEAHWSNRQLSELIDVLQQTQITREMAETAVEAPVFVMKNSLSEEPSEKLNWLKSFPGLRARDYRIFVNDYLPAMNRLRFAGPRQQAAGNYREHSTLAEFFAGKRSLMGENQQAAGDQVSNSAQAYSSYVREERTRGMLHLWAHIMLFRNQTGALPTRVQDLSQAGYRPLKGFEEASVSFEHRSGLDVFYTHPVEEYPYQSDQPAANAFTFSATDLSFTVR